MKLNQKNAQYIKGIYGQPKYYVQQVVNKHLENTFSRIPEAIYHDDPFWIPVIREEISKIFEKSQNPYFKHGEAARWIIFNKEGEVAGRIASFINFEKMFDENKKIGCIGFFECKNDKEAAFLLFDTAIGWLEENFHVDAVDGPVNFGENDKFWGLLIKGFGPVSYGMNYNPPYYQTLFEAYGFQVQYKQLTNYIDLRRPLPERFKKIAERIISNKKYSFKPFRYKKRDHFVNDFIQVYNLAWASFKNYAPIDEDVIRESLKEMKPIMEEDFIWFAYADGKPAGVLLGMPDVNEVIKHSGPRFNWWGKCKFMFFRYLKGFSCARVVVMGIVPEYQRHGLESALIFHAFNAGKKKPSYKHVQLAWVGDFNDKMIAIHKALGAVEDKQHATFRKLLPL